MEIVPFGSQHVPQAAALLVQHYADLRRAVPVLPPLMEDANRVGDMIARLMASCGGLAALDAGRLFGYIGWYIVDEFRNTERRGAFCPEWGHGAADGAKQAIYRALYRAAAARWAADGCAVHALTLLANDREAERAWFWNGFGLTVVDAIRTTAPLAHATPAGFEVRKATPADAELVAVLEAEHWTHYTQPPVFMAVEDAPDANACAEFLAYPTNAYWLAVQQGEAMGFIRFEGRSFGAAEIVASETTVAITGAYVRPAHRGRRAAPALLDAALRDYANRGFERCSVDFEAFNPEAAAFWVKHFDLVCFSPTRIPERIQPG